MWATNSPIIQKLRVTNISVGHGFCRSNKNRVCGLGYTVELWSFQEQQLKDGDSIRNKPRCGLQKEGGGYLHKGSARHFCGGIPPKGLAFTLAQNDPEGEQTLGHKPCVSIPPFCPR